MLLAALPHSHKNNDAVEVFYFPDESQKTKPTERFDGANHDRCGSVTLENPEMKQAVMEEEEEDAEDDWDDEFCILEEVTGAGIPVSTFLFENYFYVPVLFYSIPNSINFSFLIAQKWTSRNPSSHSRAYSGVG